MVFSLIAMLSCTLVTRGQEGVRVIEHVNVYNVRGKFAGWPANNGIWNWGNQIVVGFTLGDHKDKEGHTIDPDHPQFVRQARSVDGGRSWTIETPSFMVADGQERETTSLDSPFDFSNPDFAARFRNDRFYFSHDRCRTWHGPFQLPTFGRPGLLARTDYLIEGKHRITAFVAAEKESGGEGQPLCIRTVDGGLSWQKVGWIGRQQPRGYGYAIMPATVAIAQHGYLTMIRRGGVFDGVKRWWLEAFLSADEGRSWYRLQEPYIDNGGNPATLTRLHDGRLALVYGWRHDPCGIRGRLSKDGGQSWSEEFILRADGNKWDLGYPRTIELADHKLVTVYYFNDDSQVERYIAATIWSPGSPN